MAQEVIIRKAELSDMRRVFELSNDPAVRANSIHPEPIDWETHEKWFSNAIVDPDVKFYLGETMSGEFVGQVRFACTPQGWVVSISMAAAFRGKGLAMFFLTEAMRQSGETHFVAEIAEGNVPSQSLFTSCGFRIAARHVLNSGGRFFDKFEKVS